MAFNNSFKLTGGLNITSSQPVDSRIVVDYYEDLTKESTWVSSKYGISDPNSILYNGLVVSVQKDSAGGKVGDLYILIDKAAYNNPKSWSKVGTGSLTIDNYTSALAEATADNIGQIFYTTSDETVYKYMDGDVEKQFSSSSAASSEVNEETGVITYKDSEGNVLFVSSNATETTVFTAGPYIVTGEQSLAKLGTTSASGDLAGDVENLKGRVSTLETETIKDFEVADSEVDEVNSGEVKKFAEASVADRKATLTPVIGKLAKEGGVSKEGLATVTNVKNYVDEVFSWEEVTAPVEGE